jgi:hypothetical protein
MIWFTIRNAIALGRADPKFRLSSRSLVCISFAMDLQGANQRGSRMSHAYSINDDVHHQRRGPQGRADIVERNVYTIVACLPIESDGRLRYRIRSKSENVERVATEEELRRLGC